MKFENDVTVHLEPTKEIFAMPMMIHPLPSDLEKLIEWAGAIWPLDNDNYPVAPQEPTARKAFFLGHILRHARKACQAMDNALEQFEHGESLNEEAIKVAIAKLNIDALQLANFIGVASEELRKRMLQVILPSA